MVAQDRAIMNAQQNKEIPTYLTLKELAELLKVKPRTIYAWVSGADAFTLAAIFGWSDVRMALRYTHATDEAKRRAVENLVKPKIEGGPSDESVTNGKGRVAALP